MNRLSVIAAALALLAACSSAWSAEAPRDEAAEALIVRYVNATPGALRRIAAAAAQPPAAPLDWAPGSPPIDVATIAAELAEPSPGFGRTAGPPDVTLFLDAACAGGSDLLAALEQIATEDPDLRIAVRADPQLGSRDAARIAAAVARIGGPALHAATLRALVAAGGQAPDGVVALLAAAGVRIDPARLALALNDPAVDLAVEADAALARRVGAAASPALLIGGELLQGAPPAEALRVRANAAAALRRAAGR